MAGQTGEASVTSLPSITVVRIETTDPGARVYLDAVHHLLDGIATDPAWRRWWERADEGPLLLGVRPGDDRNYPRVVRADGGVDATICRRDLDFADDETARLVAHTNVIHLTLTMQDLLDLKPPPELPD